MTVCDRSKCTGCGACADACPRDCITISYDANGFYQSFVDDSKCVACGKCHKVCPANGFNDRKNAMAAYKVRRTDLEALATSTSGGVSALLNEKFLEIGGWICGCGFDEKLTLRHSLTCDRAVIETFKGSKYVQSSTSGVYRAIRESLKAGEKVLFTGTPCQVSGLKNYLGREYENLYTVDLACHGVASGKILEKYINRYQNQGKRIQNIRFRNKKEGYRDCNLNDLLIECQDGELRIDHAGGIVLWFAAGISLRESCYRCSFASTKRCGDLTLADYKGDDFSETDRQYGVSAVLVNTVKGQTLMEMIQSEAEMKEKNPEALLSRYSAFMPKNKIPSVRGRFFRDLNRLSLEKMEQKYDLRGVLPSRASLYAAAAWRKLKKLLKIGK